MAEEQMQQLRSKATELLLREEWKESVQVYSQFIDICLQQISLHHQNPHQDSLSKLNKSLCVALCNRAEAHSKLRRFREALKDCDRVFEIENAHFKTLLCKGKILLCLNWYASALDCFKLALCDPHASDNSNSVEILNGYLDKCKKFESQSKTGAFDISDWVLNGFRGKCPELAEYIGAVQVKKSEISGRGLFATKNIEAGNLVVVTKAVAIERGILSGKEESDENIQLVMWKSFIDKVIDTAAKCERSNHLISLLSSGENENQLDTPDITVFRPETEFDSYSTEKIDKERILSILDVNSLVEDSISAKVLGKNSGFYGVGLWLLASFINHSCTPNARRLHIGDHIVILMSRDIKAGEEITFAYFDVLSPLTKRKEMLKSWGFHCRCNRCKFEETLGSNQDVSEIEIGLERGIDVGSSTFRLEEGMKRWMVRGRNRGYVRASYWAAYAEAYSSERVMKRWGRQIPTIEVAVDSVVEATGSDDRVLKTVINGLKRNRSGGNNVLEMERAVKIGRGIYGKIMKKQAMRTLLELS
ncbi:hypothetical protein ACFE04_024481 [Oxalis oulophora]